MTGINTKPLRPNKNAVWSDDLRSRCVRAYMSGRNICQISRRFNVSRPTLYKHFRELGIMDSQQRQKVVKPKRGKKYNVSLSLTETAYRFLVRVKNRSAFVDEVLTQLAARSQAEATPPKPATSSGI